ncbi:MAG: hypothetical protein ABIS35_05605 [Terracoccus sp.]
MSLHAGPPDDVPWDVVRNGAFLVGRCSDCGFSGPARRAGHSVETDMRTHEVLCGSSRQAVVLEATAALTEPALESHAGSTGPSAARV